MDAAVAIKRAGATTTTDFTSTYRLPTDVGKKFIDRIADQGPTLKQVRQEHGLTSENKQISKVYVPNRMLRSGAENTAPTVGKPFQFSNVTLTPQKLDAAYELTYEATRDNLERQAFAQHADRLTTERIALDLNDQLWNGDDTNYSAAATTLNGGINAVVTTATVVSTTGFPSESSGYGFLVCEDERMMYTGTTSTTFTGLTRGADATTAATHANTTAVTFVQDAMYVAYDGVLVQITAGGNVVDGSAIGTGELSYQHFRATKALVPAKYFNNTAMKSSFRWHCNDAMKEEWKNVVQARQTQAGDRALFQEDITAPLGFGWNIDEAIPSGTLVFGPLNGIIHGMRSDNIVRRSTDQGIDAVSRSVRYYKWELWANVKLDETETFARCNDITATI